jgi:hypothetical protein
LVYALLELLRLATQLVVGQLFIVGLHRIDARNRLAVLLEEPVVAAAEYFGKEVGCHANRTAMPKSMSGDRNPDVHAAINRPRAECLPAKRQWPWQAAHDRQASAIIHRSPTCPSALGATSMNRRHYAISLQQASEDSPTLAKLAALTRESSERLQAIELLIPAALRGTVQAGPIDGTSWCLLVKSNAAAAKIRQLLPALQAHLRSRGWEVHSIRLKIQS